jgi:hypothetical protein
VSSIYTISVGSVAIDGQQSWYDEQCAGKMITVFTDNDYISVGDVVSNNITNTNMSIFINNRCVDNFIGTSASTPFASGAIALLLQAK